MLWRLSVLPLKVDRHALADALIDHGWLTDEAALDDRLLAAALARFIFIANTLKMRDASLTVHSETAHDARMAPTLAGEPGCDGAALTTALEKHVRDELAATAELVGGKSAWDGPDDEQRCGAA